VPGGPPVFKTGGRRAASSAGSIPVRLRVHPAFAELKHSVRRKIERYELTRTIDPHHFFPTIGAAAAAYRRETGTE
jgi:hypothetical protein